ncbi:MAG: hypothetical protein AB7P12_19335 [Alphaproteobacteria bacterium]
MKTLIISIVAALGISSAAFAAPARLSDSDMSTVAAGTGTLVGPVLGLWSSPQNYNSQTCLALCSTAVGVNTNVSGIKIGNGNTGVLQLSRLLTLNVVH